MLGKKKRFLHPKKNMLKYFLLYKKQAVFAEGKTSAVCSESTPDIDPKLNSKTLHATKNSSSNHIFRCVRRTKPLHVLFSRLLHIASVCKSCLCFRTLIPGSGQLWLIQLALQSFSLAFMRAPGSAIIHQLLSPDSWVFLRPRPRVHWGFWEQEYW